MTSGVSYESQTSQGVPIVGLFRSPIMSPVSSIARAYGQKQRLLCFCSFACSFRIFTFSLCRQREPGPKGGVLSPDMPAPTHGIVPTHPYVDCDQCTMLETHNHNDLTTPLSDRCCHTVQCALHYTVLTRRFGGLPG